MLKKYVDAAICRNQCDIALKNASYVDVFSGKVRKGDIGICGDKIVGVGEYGAKEEIDASGLIVCPGFIDGHVHIESSFLTPEEYAGAVVPRGTTCVIADPHEITNLCGLEGAEYIARASKNVPLEVKVMLPSCVPATPFETSGATLSADDIKGAIGKEQFFGLGEFMNFPAVISGDKEALGKAEAARSHGKICDGHAPSLRGNALNAYICGGIATDHECESAEEIDEKISKGMYIHLRHGSSARNLQYNAKAVTAANARRFLMCTDDCHAEDLLKHGHIDEALRVAVKSGLDPVTAVTIATLNSAECYHLKGRGAVAPSYFADLAVVDNLKDFNVKYVFKNGVLVAKDGKPLFDCSARYIPDCVKNTVRLARVLTAEDFAIPVKGNKVRAIGVRGGSIVTDSLVEEVRTLGGEPDGENFGDVALDGTDLNKLFVIERHKLTGNIGRGLIKGYGFKGGAIAITVSHDSHNIIALGDDNESLAKAVNELSKIGGGMAIAQKATGKVHSLALDIGGIMTSSPLSEHVKNSEKLYALAYSMGVKRELDAFMSLAFLSLAVIPHLKLLDTGLFDVDKFAFTPLEAD